jgi:HK97 family phage major capsid protein
MNRKFMPRAPLAVLMRTRPTAVLGRVRNDAGPANIEKLLGDVQAELKRVGDSVKQTAEDALKQAKDAGTLTKEVKDATDKSLTQLSALKDAADKLQQKAEELDGRQRDLEQKVASRRDGSREEVKSLGQAVVENESVKSFLTGGAKGAVRVEVNAAITSLTTSAGDLIAPDRDSEIVSMPRRRMTVRQLLTQGRTKSNLVQYAKQTTRTNNAAVVTEGGEKPESNYVWDLADAPVRTIAHWVPVSRQAMDDIPLLQSEIDSELRYGLDYAEEVELLSGSGSGQHISGLITNATAYSAPFALSGATMIDNLRLAMLQASLAEYPADGMVLHPSDWARIELTKDGENRYLWANPRALAGPSLWGLPIVATQAMTVDKFLVGAFKAAATIWDRMDVEVLISSEDRDNFIKNMLTVRAEKRLAMGVKRPLALTYGDFGNV